VGRRRATCADVRPHCCLCPIPANTGRNSFDACDGNSHTLTRPLARVHDPDGRDGPMPRVSVNAGKRGRVPSMHVAARVLYIPSRRVRSGPKRSIRPPLSRRRRVRMVRLERTLLRAVNNKIPLITPSLCRAVQCVDRRRAAGQLDSPEY
jgi:hypothetical protein